MANIHIIKTSTQHSALVSILYTSPPHHQILTTCKILLVPGFRVNRGREEKKWRTHGYKALCWFYKWPTSLINVVPFFLHPLFILYDPMDYTVHGILQPRLLEWVAFPFPRGSSQPRDQTQVSHIAGGFFTSWTTREAHEYWSTGILEAQNTGSLLDPRRSSWLRNRTRVFCIAGRFFTNWATRKAFILYQGQLVLHNFLTQGRIL